MGFLRAHNGRIWGSAAQLASVKKAADASAAKRRTYNTADTTSGGRLKAAPPTRAEKLAAAVRNHPHRVNGNDVGVRATPGTPGRRGGIALPKHDSLSRYDEATVAKRDQLSSTYKPTRKGDVLRHKQTRMVHPNAT